jgi:hypothetical protein
MPSIREFERADLPAVVKLLRVNFGQWFGDAAFLAANVIDDPWAEASLPSYLAVDEDGKVVGFIAAQARRLRFGDRPLLGVNCTQLGVDPDHRGSAAGALLVGRLLAGPQDLTWSDSSTDVLARIWRLYGGQLDHARANDWMFVLRPGRWLGNLLRAQAQRRTIRRDLAPVGALPFHAVGPRVARRAFPELAEGVTGEHATTEVIVDHLSLIMAGFQVWVDHDGGYLQHIFEKTAAAKQTIVRRLVRQQGQPIGWYAYAPRPGGIHRVLHIAAPEPKVGAVFGELIAHSRSSGAAVVAGRAEPHLMPTLRRRLAILGPARTPILHTKDPELAATLATSASLLTRLDGEVLIA